MAAQNARCQVNLKGQQFDASKNLNLPERSTATDFDKQNTGNTEDVVQACTADDQTFQSTSFLILKHGFRGVHQFNEKLELVKVALTLLA